MRDFFHTGLNVSRSDIARAVALAGTVGPGGFWYANANVSNSGDGSSWDEAFKTLPEGLAVMENYDTLYVAPGGYSANHQTPLNANAAFCRLLGWNGGQLGVGPYLTALTGAGTILDIRARGWLIDGFEFDLPATGKGIQLNETDAGARADFVQIQNCLFYGQGDSKVAIDYYGGHNVWSRIFSNEFTGIYNASNDGQAIGCSNSDVDVPSNARVADNHFIDNDKHIGMDGARGYKSSEIYDNTFIGAGLSKTATKLIDNTGGGYNHVWKNHLGGTYTIAGGYKPGTGDDWSGNFHQSDDGTIVQASLTILNPA